jgi:hypothetical protein
MDWILLDGISVLISPNLGTQEEVAVGAVDEVVVVDSVIAGLAIAVDEVVDEVVGLDVVVVVGLVIVGVVVVAGLVGVGGSTIEVEDEGEGEDMVGVIVEDAVGEGVVT